jgi:ABC-2 type transport system ATP-binding protein
MLAIDIQGLRKSYNKKGSDTKDALRGVDLSIPKGSIFGLLGPNGAGKSTIINILSGMVSKTSGKVSIMGYDIDLEHKTAKTKIGIVPQEIVIDNFFSIYQTLEFTSGYYGIKPNKDKINALLKALGLYDKRNALPRQLSGGMKRRFLIAKAMIHSPDILILDEPTAGVDIELRDQLWSYVKKLHSNGTTVIVTTHYLQEAQNLCERVAFINNGKIIQEDSVENLLKKFGTKYIKVIFGEVINDLNLQHLVVKYNKVDDYTITFDVTKNNFDCDIILRELNKLNLKVSDIEVNQVDLETIFKKIIHV